MFFNWFGTLVRELQHKSKYYALQGTLFCAGWLIGMITGIIICSGTQTLPGGYKHQTL